MPTYDSPAWSWLRGCCRKHPGQAVPCRACIDSGDADVIVTDDETGPAIETAGMDGQPPEATVKVTPVPASGRYPAGYRYSHNVTEAARYADITAVPMATEAQREPTAELPPADPRRVVTARFADGDRVKTRWGVGIVVFQIPPEIAPNRLQAYYRVHIYRQEKMYDLDESELAPCEAPRPFAFKPAPGSATMTMETIDPDEPAADVEAERARTFMALYPCYADSLAAQSARLASIVRERIAMHQDATKMLRQLGADRRWIQANEALTLELQTVLKLAGLQP